MSTRKLKVVPVSALIVAAVVVPVLQQTRIRQLAARETELRAQSVELPNLRQEVDRLRKVEVDAAEVDRLRSVDTELASLRGRIGNASRMELENTQLRTELEGQSAKLRSAVDGRFAADVALAKEKAAQMFHAQMPSFATRLSLTPEQEVAIRAILQARVGLLPDFYEKGSGGEPVLRRLSSENEAALAGIKAGLICSSDVDAWIRAVLSPEQQALYGTLQKEETNRRKGKTWRVEQGRGLIEVDEN